MSIGKTLACLVVLAGMSAFGFEYDVSEPLIKPRCKGAEPGEWTLDRESAFAKAKAEGKCTILLLTGGWWCPFCHTLEKTVLVNEKWQSYVEERGFYLAEMDFPYRYDVPEGQEWKSWRPELGKGWGFKCWYMNPEYLAENGMAPEEGLDIIQNDYVLQGEIATANSQSFTMKTWDGSSEFTYKRVAYAVLVVYGPDGSELGRVDFPWYSTSKVTASEAQEFEIQAVEQILNGKCDLCEDPVGSAVDTSCANTYDGWLSDADGISGEATFRLGRRNSRGMVKVSGSVKIGGKKTRFRPVYAADVAEGVVLEKNGVVATVSFGSSGMEGTVVCDGVGHSVSGARRVPKTQFTPGMWNIVLKSDASSASPFARGYGTLNVNVRANGKVKVSGTLGDGKSVNLSARAIAGENGVFCVPVKASMYSRKGGFGFVLWFKDGKYLNATDIAPWIAAGKNSFSTGYSVATTLSPGVEAAEEEMDLSLMNVDYGEEISGRALLYDPSMDIVSVDGRKWKGTEATLFKAVCNQRTGVLKGTFVFFTGEDESRPKKVTAKFRGVVMGGSGYGTVVVRNAGSWAVKISACGSCGE
ncbi:MAG: thioredoxin family protein [Kiritimatiellae bacterium]|nr:thioredoxin family protein [Kiritimatiellia bacterium]